VEPEWLEGLVAPLADPAVGIVGGRILALEPANRVERFGEVIHDHRRAIEDDDPPYAITMNWASPRRVLQELGGFDPGFLRGQDVDLAYRAVQAGYRIEYAAAAIVRHRNESTLRGLAGEGFVHGFHGVHLRKRHAEFLRSRGHGRGGPPRLRRIGSGLLAWARGRASPAERCETAFSAGKKAGRLLGSARFGRLDP
jgi:GT2 family glycosyltransferase